ncbi:glutathione transferase GstA [Microvirga sp. 2TAF3]|uniref:glutathione transferase GstA n=1 Tax=Microvirga sp. 2TAF3 TaxID=3233014 RepID=UPI003F9A9446
MKLYYSPGACSLAPHIVAAEAGLDVQLDKVNLSAKTTEAGQNFLNVNPKGYVPALVLDNGELLTEASVVVQYLADRAPASGLMPECGSMDRYRVQEWLAFIATELHKGFGPLWKSASEEAKQAAIDNLHRRFGLLDKSLEGRSYLMGDRFTVADAYGFTILNWTHFHKIDLSSYPHLAAYMKRVADRPKVKRTLQEEGLVKAA